MMQQFNQGKLFLIAGPCVIEEKSLTFDIAGKLKEICEELQIPLLFKASYRKANRTSLDSFQGIGDNEALNVLREIRSELKLPTTTDVHSPEEAKEVSKIVDVVQIPAFLSRQTDLLVAAGKHGGCVNIKKGQFLSPESMQFVIEKVKAGGCENIWLTERGTSFGYQDLVVDFRSIPKMKMHKCKVVMDCTHSQQKPNLSQGVTGGDPAMIETIAKAGVAVGANGLFIETHPTPETAKSDGSTMLPLHHLKELLIKLLAIKKAIDS